MDRKEVRAWAREHKDVVEAMETLRKECEDKDLPGLLALVEVSENVWAAIQLLLIAEIARARGLLDQTQKG